jgi:CAAX prenyl protease-like protein
MLLGDIDPRIDYTIRVLLTSALLIAFRKRYRSLSGPRGRAGSIVLGVVAGLIGVLLWIALILPFHNAADGDALALQPFLFRITAAALLVPFVEELLMRGYILGVITQWQQAKRSGTESPFDDVLDHQSVNNLAPGAATVFAVVGSSVAFMVGHATYQWPAAFAYGVLMAGLWIARRDLLTPIVAHATTNLVLYVYIFVTDSWGLW